MVRLKNNAEVDIDWNRGTVKILAGEIAEVEEDLVEPAMKIYPFLSIEPEEEPVVEAVPEPVKPAKKRKPRAKKASK